MAVIRLVLNVPGIADTNATKAVEPTQTLKSQAANSIINIIAGMVSGQPATNVRSIVTSIDGNAVAASGTITLASAQAADTVTVNGVVFSAVSGTPTGNQFDISGTNAQAATSLVTAINAATTGSSLVPTTVIASAALAVVTVAARVPGVAGNAYTLASSNNTRLANSVSATGRLAGGTNDASAQTFVY